MAPSSSRPPPDPPSRDPGDRIEPGAVYLISRTRGLATTTTTTATRRRCFLPRKSHFQTRRASRFLLFHPEEISTALRFRARAHARKPPSRIEWPRYTVVYSRRWDEKVRHPKPGEKPQPEGTVSLSRLFVRVYSTTMRQGAQVRARPPPPCPSSLSSLNASRAAARGSARPTISTASGL